MVCGRHDVVVLQADVVDGSTEGNIADVVVVVSGNVAESKL